MSNDGGPAYPMPMTMMGDVLPHIANEPVYGMSLRDYFAGQALAGMLAYPGGPYGKETITESAYKYADAMLEARKEKK